MRACERREAENEGLRKKAEEAKAELATSKVDHVRRSQRVCVCGIRGLSAAAGRCVARSLSCCALAVNSAHTRVCVHARRRTCTCTSRRSWTTTST